MKSRCTVITVWYVTNGYGMWYETNMFTVWYVMNGYGMRWETVKMRCKNKKYWINTEKCKV